MGKIYVLTQGEYSDYHIITATASLERAKEIKRVHEPEDAGDWDEIRIEVFEDSEEFEKTWFAVHFDSRGNTDNVHEADPDDIKSAINRSPILAWEGRPDMIVRVQANGRESAIKIAAEKRAKYLAEKAGL